MDTLEDQYEKETGKDVNFGIGPYSVEYVQWLEKLLKKSIVEILTATENLKEGEEVMVEAEKTINFLEAENKKLKEGIEGVADDIKKSRLINEKSVEVLTDAVTSLEILKVENEKLKEELKERNTWKHSGMPKDSENIYLLKTDSGPGWLYIAAIVQKGLWISQHGLKEIPYPNYYKLITVLI